MTTLNLNTIPLVDVKTAVVDVPEFGDGMTVNVRGMTVATNNMLMRMTSLLGTGEDGKPTMVANGRDQASVIAATHATDDDGNLVFGATITEAVDRVEGLAMVYRPAILRISMTATKLGRGDVDAGTVEEAEKN